MTRRWVRLASAAGAAAAALVLTWSQWKAYAPLIAMARIDVRSIRREQILDAAERLVLSRGWSDTTLARLCQEADVTNGVLTYHFADKTDIENALWDRVVARWKARLARRLERASTAAELIDALVAATVEGSDDELQVYFYLLMDAMTRALHDPAVAERARTENRLRSAELAAHLARCDDRDPRLDPTVATTLMGMALFGFMVGRAAYGIEMGAGMADHIRALLTNYVAGVRAPLAEDSRTLAASCYRAS